jgi:hypothetical protein
VSGGTGPRRKGNAWELAVRDYLRAAGLVVDRAYGAGRPDDAGDLILWDYPDVLAECKAHHRHDLAGWLDVARAKAGAHRTPLVIVKRPNVAALHGYAVTDLRGAVHLLENRL